MLENIEEHPWDPPSRSFSQRYLRLGQSNDPIWTVSSPKPASYRFLVSHLTLPLLSYPIPSTIVPQISVFSCSSIDPEVQMMFSFVLAVSGADLALGLVYSLAHAETPENH